MKAKFQWLYSAVYVLCIWKSCKLHATGHSINHVKGYTMFVSTQLLTLESTRILQIEHKHPGPNFKGISHISPT